MTSFTPLGSFVSADTPAARIDARVKLALLLAATVSLFLSQAAWTLAAWAAVLVGVVWASGMKVRDHLRALVPVVFILAFTLIANALALDGHGSIPIAGPVGLDPAGAQRGFTAVARIVILLGLALAVSSSTTPPQLADGCVRLMRPLARLGVPVSDIGLMLSLALRFIPIVSEEFFRIKLAQRARGVDFDDGGLIARIRSWASVLTPLVVRLFRRADRLGESMAARCYAESADAMGPRVPLAARDRWVLAAGLALCCALPVLAHLLH